MQKQLLVKGKTLAGVSDLTLFAPIRQGFVPSLESVTYRTRLEMLLKTLGASRASSQEYSLVRPFSDSVERVAAIHSVRLAIVEPESKLMLAATFDGAWDTYIRTLWLKVGTLLDVIFCNTEGYVVSSDNGFDAWAAWAGRVQAESQFFYGTPQLTVPDVRHLRMTERLSREAAAGSDVAMAGARVERAEDLAWQSATAGTSPPDAASAAETLRQGLQGLSVLYRLADVYLPGTADGDILLRAARDLLLELVELGRAQPPAPALPAPVAERFRRQLAWFNRDPGPGERPRRPFEATPFDRSDVQGGIVRGYAGITHGCLLMIGFPDPHSAADFLDRLLPRVTRDDAQPAAAQAICNVAFTHEGLRALGLAEAELARFPMAFREGMAARAGVLGDLRGNHPRRWRPPLRNWPAPQPGAPMVELSAVHLVVQLRVQALPCGDALPRHFDDLSDPRHPLHAHIRELVDGCAADLLSVQPMWRNHDPRTGVVREHFGFADGISQPVPDPAAVGAHYDGRAHLGDLLLGYPNTFDPAPPADDLLHNGSFLVIRRLRQDVAALHAAADAARATTGLSRPEMLAKMMGRTLDGAPLVTAAPAPNDFNYDADPQGEACPLQSHVRRANPRPGAAPRTDRETPVPRIMRRGMSYGPPFNAADPADPCNAQERGIVFMAYNARIAEQFEVIQRWLSGGNSSGGLSAPADPLLGVPTPGDPRTFRFVHQGVVRRVDLDAPAGAPLGAQRGPFVQLEWGAYLFAPSLKALASLQRLAAGAASRPRVAWSVDEGEQIIDRLIALESRPGVDLVERWKGVLEDPTPRREFTSAAVWAAIRERRGGVLRTPYGVLVAGRDLVDRVLTDARHHYTVEGYRERTALSFGEIYLGLDRDAKGGRYDQEATAANRAIQAITQRDAFELSRQYAREILAARIRLDQSLAQALGKPSWELNLDTKEVTDHVLASLCEEWFGLNEAGGRFERGGQRWDWNEGDAIPYPGHFTAPSRYVFQPRPGTCPVDIGQRHGRALRVAMRAFCEAHRAAGTVPSTRAGRPARVGAAIFGDPLARADADWFARTCTGALVGFLPSVDGNFRATLNEWLQTDEFWRLRQRLAAQPDPASFDAAQQVLEEPMKRAMQLRPLPESVWRTARKPHRLGTLRVRAGERVVVGLVSATQHDLAEGRSDVTPVFGGVRSPHGPRPGHPTHACPGYAAGMGVLLGLHSALLTIGETLRPSPAPLSLTVSGPTPPRP